jgi:hypothetical protein
MRDPRNPFLMSASEHMPAESTFLKLFAPDIFDLLPADGLFAKLHFFQSSAGGGKTSILRVFTPKALLVLHANRQNNEYDKLYKRLENLEVLNEAGPRLLGIMLPLARSYAALEDMQLDDARKNRLMFTLLDSRIMLTALRGAMALKRMEYPDDLKRLSITIEPELAEKLQLPKIASGEQLYIWAGDMEKNICRALGSLQPIPPVSSMGHDSLNVVNLLIPQNIRIDGNPVAERILLMLDDVHKLTNRQRQRLLGELVDLRNTFSIWIAERLDALGSSVLDPGAIRNRDYGDVIDLEKHWRKYPKKFELTTTNIADRRAQTAKDVEIQSFSGCLQSSLDGTASIVILEDALQSISARIQQQYDGIKFSEWIANCQNLKGSLREKLLAWKTAEIYMERERYNAQLAFDIPLSAQDLDSKGGSAVRTAAELFLSREFHLPYYFGFSTVAAIASSNIEQFLNIAGELFEEAAAAALVNKPHDLSPARQEIIITKVAKRWWEEELPKRIPFPRETRLLINAIGKVAVAETYRLNAPYAPGVTGIAITDQETKMLSDADLLSKRSDLRNLAKVLQACIAHNILEAEMDHSQGYQRWMVLRLNRLLCVYFKLPWQRGDWRPKKLRDLSLWIQGIPEQSANSGNGLL